MEKYNEEEEVVDTASSHCGWPVLESGGECGSRCRVLSSQLSHLRGVGGECVLLTSLVFG